MLFSLNVYPILKKQTDFFKRISSEQGLPQISVKHILQDRQGFMWFGTSEGLVKYDGYKFIYYRHNTDDTKSLSKNNITALCEDAE